MGEAARIAFRRIVLGFSLCDAPGPALDAAAALARWLDAELLGLFVENAALYEYAKLPFAREIAPGAAWRPLPLERLAGDYLALAAALQRRLREAAASQGVRVEFETVRGDPLAALAQASADDLLAQVEPADPFARWSLARAPAAGRLFLPRRVRRVRGPVAVVAARPGDAALAVAARIAAAAGEGIVLLQAGGEWKIDVPLAERRRLAAATPAAAATALQAVRERVLVVAEPADEATAAAWMQLAAERGVPLMLVACEQREAARA